jgi:hypothetical protein
MLFFALLLISTHAVAQEVGTPWPAPAANAAAHTPAGVTTPGSARPAGQRQHAPAPAPAARAPKGPEAGTPGMNRVATPATGSAPPTAGADAPAAVRPAAVSERMRREAEHPYFWIRRNGDLAYQRYAARVAQARAEGLPPPPTRAASGRLPLPATAFDPEALPPTGAGPAAPGTVPGAQPPGAR